VKYQNLSAEHLGKILFDESGNPVTLVGTTLDITEQVKLRAYSQELASIILAKTSKLNAPLKILDVGTGSGVLGLTLAAELGGKCESLTLSDISPDALALAKENTTLLGLARVELIESDLFSALKEEKYHLIVANLPYIAETNRESLSQEVQHDPDTALFGGKDGLDILRKFIQQAPFHLHPAGLLALEIGHDQANKVESLLSNAGFQNIHTHKDLCGIPRFPIASHPGSPEQNSPDN